MASRSERILMWSIVGVVGAGFLLLIVFGEIFQCQRTATTPRMAPPRTGEVVQVKPGVSTELKTPAGEISLPPGSLLEVTGVRKDAAEVRLVCDGTAGEWAWNDGSRVLYERADPELVGLYARESWSALEALELARPFGRGWSRDAFPYAAASGEFPEGGRSREWEVAFYSDELKRVLLVLFAAGAQPAVQEVSTPEVPADDHRQWPLGSAKLALGEPAVDSPAALQAALVADDRREREKSRWELFRIYLVNQDDPLGTGEPWRGTATYRVLQRLAVRMNPDDEAAFTMFIVDAQTGQILARLP